MQKKIKKLDQKINQITLTYRELQKTEFYIVKKTLIGTLRRLCAEGLQILDKEIINGQSIRKRKQIEDMLKKCIEIQQKLDTKQKNNPEIGNGSRSFPVGFKNQHQKKPENEELPLGPQFLMDQKILIKKSREVAKSIIFYEISSQNMKVSPQQIDKLAERIQTNNAVMKQIQLMVIEQGGDIDKIQQNIQETYQMVENANVELDKAADQQRKNRILKIRLGVSGFLGAFGLKILGLPGLILGFFSGMIATQ